MEFLKNGILMRRYQILLLTVITWLCMGMPSSPAQNRMKGPDHKSEGRTSHGDESRVWLFTFYQKYISPVDGEHRCPMMPSCSEYARQAFDTLPIHKAYIRTFDRLMRCGHELYYYPVLLVNGRLRWGDPVDRRKRNEKKNE